jgi:peptide deformylase
MKILFSLVLLMACWVSVLPGCKKHNEVFSEVIADSLFYTHDEISAIYSYDSTQAFTILSVSNPLDSVILKKVSRNVKVNNDTTDFLISRMFQSVYNYTGNIDGITAPEIGINRNIIIVKRKDKPGTPFEVFLNPKITQHSNSFTTYQENCITRQGMFPTTVDRFNLVFVDYYTSDGIHHSEMIEGETGAIVQHEVAHLGGGVLAISFDPLAFTGQEIDSIMADTVAMRIYLTTNYQDSLVLRKTSIDVRPDASNPVLIRAISRLRKSLAASPGGVGIAAPQIGINRNIILVKRQDKIGTPIEVYLNPKIVMTSDSIINFAGDGCLSMPGIYKTTRRYTAVGLEYDLLDGTHKYEVVFGYAGTKFTAVIFQHEIDHLNGILFIDRAI